VRFDPDAKVHYTGDQRQVWGCKFWLAYVRGQDPHCRITIAVDHVPSVRGEENSEADVATKNLLDLAPLAPGASAPSPTPRFEEPTWTDSSVGPAGSS
jgi:hypothetical protein